MCLFGGIISAAGNPWAIASPQRWRVWLGRAPTRLVEPPGLVARLVGTCWLGREQGLARGQAHWPSGTGQGGTAPRPRLRYARDDGGGSARVAAPLMTVRRSRSCCSSVATVTQLRKPQQPARTWRFRRARRGTVWCEVCVWRADMPPTPTRDPRASESRDGHPPRCRRGECQCVAPARATLLRFEWSLGCGWRLSEHWCI